MYQSNHYLLLISDINSFVRDNLWIYHIVFILLLILILYYIILLRKTRKNKDESTPETKSLISESQEKILFQQDDFKKQSANILDEENLILTMINVMPDRIYIKDRESRFIIGNIHVAKIMGAENPEDLIGKTDYDFYPKEFADDFFRDEQNLIKRDGQIINEEEKGYNLIQEEIVVSTTKVPLKNKKGNIIGIVGISRDISDQKEAEKQSREKYKALQEIIVLEEKQEKNHQQAEELKAQTESLSAANIELEKLSLVASKTDNSIIIMDGNGNFEWVNEGFKKRYGMNLNKFIKAHGKNLLENSSNKEIIHIFEKIKKNKTPCIYESQSTNAAGEKIWSQTTISPILDKNGEIIRLIVIDTDISKIKEAEAQIGKQRDELTTLIATKDKFFSIIAHDLKNPIHSIMGFSELLSRNFNSFENEKRLEFIKLIYNSSTSVYGLLENLLNWAMTQSNKINYKPGIVDLRIIISEVAQMLLANAKNKNISLNLPLDQDEIKVFADYNMVNTILRNFISNSLKFTKEGGEISLLTKKLNGKVTITIKDT
ncbi:MAG: PAS domain-containing protein, partial [Bacteroidales bacterium]|nr:PAS domain-containing protein [Bacteroidales bacterium]